MPRPGVGADRCGCLLPPFAAAPEVARAREEKARQARFAKRCRGDAHGMASFLIRADIATITGVGAIITAVAAASKPALPDTGVDERRLSAIMRLLHRQVPADNPARAA